MPLSRSSIFRYAVLHKLPYSTRQAARDGLRSRNTGSSLPILPSCPAPTCECADMPADLDIDRSTDLNSTMAPYQEHLVVATGQADWKSRIEDEKGTAPWGDLVASVKSALGLKGQFHNPYHNVVVSTSSFETPQLAQCKSRALLFPSFRMIENVESSESAVTDFIRTFLLPEKLNPAYAQHTEPERIGKVRSPGNISSSRWAGNVHPITAPTILICSHNSRDSRCGILGPLLHAEFEQYINKRHTLRNRSSDTIHVSASAAHSFTSHPTYQPDFVDGDRHSRQPINVGMISHIGGHKFAGNVIVYIPPDYECRPIARTARGPKPKDKEMSDRSGNSDLPHEDDTIDPFADSVSPLAGKGIWYGRVEPKHVEGIVEQTIGHGRIIKDLFRGGINHDGSTLRLPLYYQIDI